MVYIWQKDEWPALSWDDRKLSGLLAHVSREQGRLLGRMETLGFDPLTLTEIDPPLLTKTDPPRSVLT